MKHVRILFAALLLATGGLVVPLSGAWAEVLLSQLVVELVPGNGSRADVEIWNNGKERTFVVVDPREITNPGTPQESSRQDPDPEKLGLLVSPDRVVLEPGQRRLLRIASIAQDNRERVYRVTVKPVVGELASETSGLKVLVGYDVLVLSRPSVPKPLVHGKRSGGRLLLTNDGNVSVELVDGKACDASMRSCEDLPGGRLYAGAERAVEIGTAARAEYKLKVGAKLLPVAF